MLSIKFSNSYEVSHARHDHFEIRKTNVQWVSSDVQILKLHTNFISMKCRCKMTTAKIKGRPVIISRKSLPKITDSVHIFYDYEVSNNQHLPLCLDI